MTALVKAPAKIRAESFRFLLAWWHRAPYPRRTRAQRKADYEACCRATYFNVTRIEGHLRRDGRCDEDASWRGVA